MGLRLLVLLGLIELLKYVNQTYPYNVMAIFDLIE